MTRGARSGLFLPLLGLLLATPLAAQLVSKHDSNAPVNLDADRIEVQDRADRVIVSGNVSMTQAGMKLRADRLVVAYTRARGTGDTTPNPDIQRIDATGGVVVTKDDQVARGNSATYDLNTKIVTMLGNVELTQGANHLSGGRVIMDLNSGRATVDGRSSGADGTGAGGNGRVTGIFTVPQHTNPQ